MAIVILFMDNLISTLKKSVNELEEFQVQLALGKVEAKDKFEELKGKFNDFLHTSKQKLTVGKERKEKLQESFDDLQVQLALGKADSIDLFNEQKKKILSSISKLEKSMVHKTAVLAGDLDEKFRHEVERFRIKMEMLRVHYELGKLDAKDEFEERKHDFTETVAKLKAKFDARQKVASQNRQLRHKELKEAYKHMKKAFVSA